MKNLGVIKLLFVAALALRRLIESELSVLINSHKYYWKKLKSEKDVEISEEDMDKMIHEIREKRSA
ncbi:MAG: hypothetical protein KKD69_06695 [Euryarchaeota archaeon]|nr:hypothetical protein [Euryarchaeota archaeon]MBU4492134.1 hypothetical protein [Euryarchaeota archaeon]MCG2727348.1 hypothetical protein [Candidatus Methanoperedenaceae archaeon]